MKLKLLFSFFLLLIMVGNVAVTYMQQVQSQTECEVKECKDDCDNSSDSEKESKTEKDLFSFSNVFQLKAEFWASNFSANKIYALDESFPSALHALLLDNPPEV